MSGLPTDSINENNERGYDTGQCNIDGIDDVMEEHRVVCANDIIFRN